MSSIQSTPDAGISSRQPGIREAMFFAIAAGFASLMMDFHEGAVVCDVAAIALWATGWFADRRPSALSTIVVGAGIVVTTIWWPKEFWWQAAITLLWIGIALIVAGLAMGLVQRVARHAHKRP